MDLAPNQPDRDDMDNAVAAAFPGARILGCVPLTGGSSAAVSVLDVVELSGQYRRVVFRQHKDRSLKEHGSGIAAKEFHILSWLQTEGFEVPRPLVFHDDSTPGDPWLLMEWVDAAEAHDIESVGAVVDAMAGFLARLHQLPCNREIAANLAAIEDPEKELFAYMPEGEVGQSVLQALGRGIVRSSNRDVVLHGDFWPGNVMFQGQELAAVLDWEDAALGDPLADLACARVEISCAFGWAAAERFTAVYLAKSQDSGEVLDQTDLPLWEIYVAATALSSMHRWGLSVDEEQRRRNQTTDFYERAAAALQEQ